MKIDTGSHGRGRRSLRHAVVVAACAALLAACSSDDDDEVLPPPEQPEQPQPPEEPQLPAEPHAALKVLSSPAEWVSGGDARIEVHATNVAADALELWLNDVRVDVPMKQSVAAGGLRLEGVVDGLVDGENLLEVRSAGAALAALILTNHPITGPMFSGPKQAPFVCAGPRRFGREPLVDSSDPNHFEVRDSSGAPIGYSRDCSLESWTEYVYMPVGGTGAGDYRPMPADGSRPADIARTTLLDGREVDFVVRIERGTINRFIYQYYMLAPIGEDPGTPDTRLWNGRLVYSFQGGVGFGHYQGDQQNVGDPVALGKGYAIAYSTGTRTSVHYNMVLGGETAMMTKERFVERYGVPLYTVGTGASGGAIQQYLYAQNHPGLLDAAIATQNYPDMVGQIPHVGDCELLEYYMDVTDRANPAWGPATVKNRSWLVGMNAEDSVPNEVWPIMDLLGQNGYPVGGAPGATECRTAWIGLTAGALNPHFDADQVVAKAGDRMPSSAFAGVQFSHYDDARTIYGEGVDGHPRTTWDNVGVQYGLRAMLDGNITPDQFLDLNFKIGGWKRVGEMVPEGFPYNGTSAAEIQKVQDDPSYFDVWSRRNMNAWNPAAPNVPAPRTHGDVAAMRAAYESGLVFTGQIDIPIINWHPYLEHRLDMHNVHQAFAARKRIVDRMGSAGHQVIWFTETRGAAAPFDQRPMALEVMDEWLANIRATPDAGIAANRPGRATDACFDTDGSPMAAGDEVWAGILDPRPKGECTLKFPIYSTSRIVAGGPIEGGIFKCALKPVDTAVTDGTYGSWTPDPAQLAMLHAIFPEGVCDWSKPDQGRPG